MDRSKRSNSVWYFVPVASALLAALASCSPEIVLEPFTPASTHADYLRALGQLELLETELGLRWVGAAASAVDAPLVAELPFRESVHFDPVEPTAVGYRFIAARGRRVTIEFDTELERYFADVLRLPDRPDGEPVVVASRPTDRSTPAAAGSDSGRPSAIVFESRHGGEYLLRVQPELLRGGRLDVSIVERAALAFPVDGVGPSAIWSFYGDPRDGGARIHEGVDIFAPRGTPLLAASDARVIRVGWRDRGGNVVTLQDDARDLRLYYAHLDTQLVREGDRVRAGDVIGTIGNTGNAVTTPPHLHLGVYLGGWGGAVDPWDYLVDPPLTGAPEARYDGPLGGWHVLTEAVELERTVSSPAARAVFVNRNPILRRQGAGDAGLRVAGPVPPPEAAIEPEPLILVPSGSAVRVVGATRHYVRVRTADGSEGVVPAAVVHERRVVSRLESPVLARDIATGDIVATIPAGTEVEYVGPARLRGGSDAVVVLPTGRVVIADYVVES